VPCSEHACLKRKFEGSSGVSQLAIMTDGNLAAIRNEEQIDIYSPTGSRLRTVGEFGAEPGEFDGAWDVAIGANGSLFVADYYNDRIQELKPDGQVEEFPAESPEKVTVSPAGTIYFSDSSQITRAADSTGPGYSWGADGTDQTGFRWTSAIAVDSSGDVYVVESINNRAFRFGDIGTGIVNVKWVTSGKGVDPGEFRRATGLTVVGDRVYVADVGGSNVHVLNAEDGSFLFTFPVTDDEGFDISPEDIAVDTNGNVYIADGSIYVYSLKS
jgi:sugar lactone lactonase YvrE